MTTSIKISCVDGEFAAYVAAPDGPPRAALLVIQEIFGVNTGIRRKCDLLAQEGYLAISPDLYWRAEPDLQLDPDVPSSMQRALDLLLSKFDENSATTDIQATIDVVRTMIPDGVKIGLVGYCLGGRLAYLAATRTNIDAAVGYYGVNIDLLLGEKDDISAPLMLHMAGEDPFVDEAKLALIHEALDNHPLATVIDYPGEHHGFARELGSNRSDKAAAAADERTMAFLRDHLETTPKS